MKIYFQVVMLLGMVDKKLYNGTEVLSLNLNSIINLLINVINGRYQKLIRGCSTLKNS